MSKDEKTCAKVDFRKHGEQEIAASLNLTGASAAITQSPEKLRALMEALDLPEGTTATVSVTVSSTVVR